MIVVSNLFYALAKIIGPALELYSWIIIARALVSWVSPDPFNPIVQFLERATEPFLSPIRRLLPSMAIDISPLIALLIVMFAKTFLVQTLLDISFSMRT